MMLYFSYKYIYNITNTIWMEDMKKRKNVNNTYLSEHFLIELGINFDFPNILKVLKRIDYDKH